MEKTGFIIAYSLVVIICTWIVVWLYKDYKRDKKIQKQIKDNTHPEQ